MESVLKKRKLRQKRLAEKEGFKPGIINIVLFKISGILSRCSLLTANARYRY